ncbi:hypothetical protein ILYODFUR_021485 [Ilyodon furcidens]|uniref:Uncharacterized protein n=1 Tax=Ilyodon furcidens TaxID=33524 RepID=A0ABV0TB35_9TELE
MRQVTFSSMTSSHQRRAKMIRDVQIHADVQQAASSGLKPGATRDETHLEESPSSCSQGCVPHCLVGVSEMTLMNLCHHE